MSIYEQVIGIVTDDDGKEEVVSQWVRWEGSSTSPRGTKLPSERVPGLVKAVAEHCGVRKVDVTDGVVSPIDENVRNWRPPTPPVPMSKEDSTLLAVLVGGAVLIGGALALAHVSDAIENVDLEEVELEYEDEDEVEEMLS